VFRRRVGGEAEAETDRRRIHVVVAAVVLRRAEARAEREHFEGDEPGLRRVELCGPEELQLHADLVLD
jgi:hypothetical protein